MKHVNLILRESVVGLGDAGALVKVKTGYARNYLVPRGKAVTATDANVKELKHQKRVIADKAAKQLLDLNASRDRLAAIRLEVTAQAGEEGKLFGSVTAAQIGELLGERGFAIDRRKIALTEPIKELGEHKVSIRLRGDVIAEITVAVSASTD